MSQKPFYITTTLPYVNAPLHVGHALEFIRADAIARYKKLQGYEVFFNSGTDEHGVKIYNKALEAKKSPREFIDEAFIVFKKQVDSFGISDETHFIRTSDFKHEKAAPEFWKRVNERGYIYKKNYQAKYCPECEQEKTDSQLVNGKCPDHPMATIEIINEENYFFKFSEFQKPLLEFYKSRPDFVIPDFRFNETKSFVERGLLDFPISRLKEKMPWGIPVPGDDKHVMYVWFDALTNYINTLGWPDEGGDFKKYWIEGTPTQYCGKDNNRFQAAIWQAMLMAAGIKNSYQIVINGHVTGGGGIKMSKSLGNVVDPLEIVKDYGTDALRFFLLAEFGFEDSPFTMERFKDAYNAKLANGLGNLTSRIMKMAETNLLSSPFQGEVLVSDGVLDPQFTSALDRFEINKACDFVWQKISALDRKIQETAPFKLVKTDKEKGVELIKEMVIELHSVATQLEPILPETSKKILDLIVSNKSPEVPLFARKD